MPRHAAARSGPGPPGGFLNRPIHRFGYNVRLTQVQGTRCAELALFVVLESPVVNAADHPSHYRDQPGLDFLRIVPTTWDDTRTLHAAVGESIVIARRHGTQWFLGALTDRHARTIPVPLDFLGTGPDTMRLWHDAPDSLTDATRLLTTQRTVTATETLTIPLAPAGGAVAVFAPE